MQTFSSYTHYPQNIPQPQVMFNGARYGRRPPFRLFWVSYLRTPLSTRADHNVITISNSSSLEQVSLHGITARQSIESVGYTGHHRTMLFRRRNQKKQRRRRWLVIRQRPVLSLPGRSPKNTEGSLSAQRIVSEAKSPRLELSR
jgi:hypothetical protein